MSRSVLYLKWGKVRTSLKVYIKQKKYAYQVYIYWYGKTGIIYGTYNR